MEIPINFSSKSISTSHKFHLLLLFSPMTKNLYHKFLCLKPCGGHVDQNINQTPRRFFHYFSNSDCFLGVMSKLRNLNSESRQCGNLCSCPDL